MRVLKSVFLALAMMLPPALQAQSQSGLPAPSIAPTGVTTYQAGTTYTAGQIVIYLGVTYQSLVNSNTGNTPVSSPSFWTSTIASGGAATPATSNLLKGTGSVNGVASAVPGTDYVIPAGNAATATALATTPTTCSGGQAPTGILANGNATGCQAISAQVYPAAGVPNSTGTSYGTSYTVGTSASNLLQLNGSAQIPGVSGALLTGLTVSQVTGAAPLASPTFTGTPAVPTATGGTNTTQAASTAFVQAAVSSAGGMVYPAAGIANSTGSAWGTSYTAGTAANNLVQLNGSGQLPAVSAALLTNFPASLVNLSPTTSQLITQPSGTYLGINDLNNIFWLDGFNSSCTVNGTAYTSQGDCAFYYSKYYATTNATSVSLIEGNAHYTTNASWIEPTGAYVVNIFGQGPFNSYLTYTGVSAIPVISRALGSPYAFMHIGGMTINGNYVASADLDLLGLNQSDFPNLELIDIAPSQTNFVRMGSGFQVLASNWNIFEDSNGSNNYNGPTTYATISCTPSAGTINTAACTIANGGAGYPTTPAALTVFFNGTQNGASYQGCTSMPVATATVSGGAVASVTVGTNGTGCVGTMYAVVANIFPVTYGVTWSVSDSTMNDVTTYVGKTAGFNITAGSGVYHHLHPALIPNGILNTTNSTFEGTELDSILQKGFDLEAQGTYNSSTIYGTNTFFGTRNLQGAAAYYFGSGGGNVIFGPQGSLCGAGKPTGWNEFLTQTGTLDSGTGSWPAGTAMFGNDQTCAGVGDYSPLMQIAALKAGAITLNGGSFTGTQCLQEVAGVITVGGSGCGVIGQPLSQFAATTSSQLRGIISDETGTGTSVFNTSPTLVTPVLGAATATSLNGLSLTANTTGFSIAGGSTTSKTLTVNNSLTLAGTDGTTMTFPAASTTMAGLGTAETFSALQTFTAAPLFNSGFTFSTASQTTSITGYSGGSGANQGAFQFQLTNNTAATSSQNYKSPAFNLQGNYYNGTTNISSSVIQQLTYGSGANPTAGYQWTQGGTASSGANFFYGFDATVQGLHLKSSSGTPTIAAGTGAGTTPTVAIVTGATDVSGYFTVTTGTTPTATATVVTVTFATTYISSIAPKCYAWPANAATQALVGAAAAQIFPANITTTGFGLTQGSTALTAATAYEWGYQCTQ